MMKAIEALSEKVKLIQNQLTVALAQGHSRLHYGQCGRTTEHWCIYTKMRKRQIRSQHSRKCDSYDVLSQIGRKITKCIVSSDLATSEMSVLHPYTREYMENFQRNHFNLLNNVC